jgi:hypothetical protein
VRGVAPADLATELKGAGIEPMVRDDAAEEDDLVVGADPTVDLCWLDDA